MNKLSLRPDVLEPATDNKMSSPQENSSTEALSNSENALGNSTVQSTPRRYLILTLFFIVAAVNNFTFSYSIVADSFVSYYAIDNFMVNLMSNIVLLGFIIGVFPAIYIFEHFGLRIGVLLGVFLTAVGAGIFVASVHPGRFYVVLSAQIIMGIGQPFNLVVPTYLAAIWFPAEEVSRCCAIASLSSPFGNYLGAALLPLIISGKTADLLHNQFLWYHSSFCLLCVVLLLISFIAFQDHPEFPPSRSRQESLDNPAKVDIGKSLLILFRDRNFMIHFVSFGFIAGFLNTIVSVINEMVLQIYPDEKHDLYILGLLLLISGIIACVSAGQILDKFQKFKFIDCGWIFCAAVTLIIFAVCFERGMYAIYGITFLVGCSNGYWPVGLELGAELTYPISEVISSSLLFIIAYIGTIIFTFCSTALLEPFGVFGVNLFFISIAVVSFILAAFIKPDYRRLEANRQKNLSQQNVNETNCPVYCITPTITPTITPSDHLY